MQLKTFLMPKIFLSIQWIMLMQHTIFFEQYTEALIVSAYDEVKHAYQNINSCLPAEQENVMHSLLDKNVDAFAIPTVQSDIKIDSAMFKCSECDKSYKRMASLRKHQKEKHSIAIVDNSNSSKNEFECKFCHNKYKQEGSFRKHMTQKHPQLSTTDSRKQQDASQSCIESTMQDACGSDHGNDDFVYRYSCAALCLGLLTMNFNNARKLGDGD
jgi:hypothetical protein